MSGRGAVRCSRWKRGGKGGRALGFACSARCSVLAVFLRFCVSAILLSAACFASDGPRRDRDRRAGHRHRRRCAWQACAVLALTGGGDARGGGRGASRKRRRSAGHARRAPPVRNATKAFHSRTHAFIAFIHLQNRLGRARARIVLFQETGNRNRETREGGEGKGKKGRGKSRKKRSERISLL